MSYETDSAEALRWAIEMANGGKSPAEAYAICQKDWNEVHGYVGRLPFAVQLIPTYACPGPGYTWQVRNTLMGPSGLWVFSGDPTGLDPKTRTVAQYALAKGVSSAVAFTFKSEEQVNAYLEGRPARPEVFKASDAPVFAGPPKVDNGDPLDRPTPRPVTPEHLKALELQAAVCAVKGLSIYNVPGFTPKELNDVMGSFNPAYNIAVSLLHGLTVAVVAQGVIGQAGFEAYTIDDVAAIAARVL